MARQRTAARLVQRLGDLEAQIRALGGDPSGTSVRAEGGRGHDGEGLWRFFVRPPGRRFGWKGQAYGSDPKTGLLEVTDPDFANALRQRAARDMVEELPVNCAFRPS